MPGSARAPGGAAPAPDGTTPVWTPRPPQIRDAAMTAFMRFARECGADGVLDYRALYRWSIERPDQLWPAIWKYCAVVCTEREHGEPWDEVVVGLERMAPPDPDVGPRWFTGARLNFAENLLRHRGPEAAITAWNERGRYRTLSFDELRAEVARVARAMRSMGVAAGDRVAGFLPNVPEAVIAMLAAASVGALWSSCSPDFGVKGVLDRFGQIEPKLLICADGYRYAGKEIDCLERVREIVDALPQLERVVVVPYLDADPDARLIRRAVGWRDFAPDDGFPPPLEFERLPFDHPLYIMYSSGTTGLPKCMVHGAGGTLLQHLKELALHCDIGEGDRLFYFTTCGWMMWNWMASALALGAGIVLYDGAPLAPDPSILWKMAERERVTVFGTSAKYLALLEKAGLEPGTSYDLSALQAILSTGSPLPAHGYDYVARAIGPGIRLSSISGGTDIISCFALGNPIAPVWRGELQTRGLGMAVEVWDEAGRPVEGVPGELVCTRPFPSMPVAFWRDPDGAKYRAAYFEHFPNVWRHGDWAELTEHDGVIIHGRSDATLNPGGVRIGTAEIYRQVEQLPEVVECLAIEQALGDDDSRVVLFVRLREGESIDEPLRERIRGRIREHTSPHHVPKKIVQVADIPRTISGKISELAVRDVVHGRAVKNTDALANPQALDLFRDLPELRD
ncbi:MAG TPA: acetoacetate--CoA ligase [Gemmatimonadaceae bacterium]|nr:acetoacetate--CoA ligase [Gemmatimonadaceae bacterium]